MCVTNILKMNAKYRAVAFALSFICLRYSNGCLPSVKQKLPLKILIEYIEDEDDIICTSQGKDNKDLLEIILHNDHVGIDEKLDSTFNNKLIIYDFLNKVKKNNTKVYCHIKNGNNMVLKTTNKINIVFDQDDETNGTQITSTTIAVSYSTTPSNDATDVLPIQDELGVLNPLTEIDSDSLLLSPLIIGGLVMIGVLLVILLTGFIICLKKRRLRVDVSKDDVPANSVVQYVQLKLEPTVSSRPLTQETPYAEIVGVVKKNQT